MPLKTKSRIRGSGSLIVHSSSAGGEQDNLSQVWTHTRARMHTHTQKLTSNLLKCVETQDSVGLLVTSVSSICGVTVLSRVWETCRMMSEGERQWEEERGELSNGDTW
ncbi:unnamed protein product [Arctogadus glacialis]